MESRKRTPSVSPRQFEGKRSRSNGSSSLSPSISEKRVPMIMKSDSGSPALSERFGAPTSLERAGSATSSSNCSMVQTFCSEMMKSMNEFREANVLCDVTICVGGQTFSAHRTVLAASSPYFKALFASTLNSDAADNKPVVLTDIDSECMESLLQYIYTGEIQLTKDNIRAVISAANYLLVSSLKQRCTVYLQKMLTPKNCLSIESTASQFDCELLKSTATSFIRENFIMVASTAEFLDMSMERLRELVASDDTKVDREEQIFEAIMKWVRHDEDERKNHFKKLVSFVRFPLISPYYLMDHVESEELVRNTPECIALLLEAKNYHMLPDRRWQLKSTRITPRVSMGIVNGIIAVGGIQGPCKWCLFYRIIGGERFQEDRAWII